jgi:DNA-binding ferritin-like protein
MSDDDAAVPAGLNRILADCFVLRSSLQTAAWRLQPDDPRGLERLFQGLIAFLDDTAAATAVRIQVLGGQVASSFEDLVQLASCRMPGPEVTEAEDIGRAIMAVVRDFHTMAQISRGSGDEATAHMLFGRVARLEEAMWRCTTLPSHDPSTPPAGA